MIGAYTVKKLTVGDIVRVTIKEIPHWAVVVADKYPTDETVYVSIISSRYTYTNTIVKITPEQFPPINKESYCTLQFKALPRDLMLKSWVGRVEDRNFAKTVLNAWYGELNKMRAAQEKQLKALNL